MWSAFKGWFFAKISMLIFYSFLSRTICVYRTCGITAIRSVVHP